MASDRPGETTQARSLPAAAARTVPSSYGKRRAAGRLVVKIGTNTLRGADGRPDGTYLASVADQVAALRTQGWHVILVSSGAIGAGMAQLGLRERPQDVQLRQALAATGQPLLMRAWSDAFARHGIHVAQLLLTHHSFTRRESFLNLKHATQALLGLGVVPIANENDTVSIAEIDASFGDNDRLAAYVAAKTGASTLVILSDVAGLHTRPPGHPQARLVPVVERITDDIVQMAANRAGAGGRGGMGSKLEAVRIATRSGIPVVIAKGREPNVLIRVVAGEPLGTRFLPQGGASAKKRWLEIAKPQGQVEVDEGAAKALREGRHLLPAGVLGVLGEFGEDAVIEIRTQGRPIAKALTGLGSGELRRAQGKRSAQLAALLGRKGPFNVTRKNNLVLLDAPGP